MYVRARSLSLSHALSQDTAISFVPVLRARLNILRSKILANRLSRGLIEEQNQQERIPIRAKEEDVVVAA